MEKWRWRWIGIFCFFLLTACATEEAAEPTVTVPPLTEKSTAVEPTPTATVLLEISPTFTMTPTVAAEAESQQHRVQSGDTLLALAMQYDVPLAAIQQANGMGASVTVQVGTLLEIPAASAWEDAAPFWVLYEVTEGDNLSKIAQRYQLQVTDLTSVNQLGNAGTIHAGEFLILPLTGPAVAAAVPTVTPLPPTPVPATATVPAPTLTTVPLVPTPTPAPTQPAAAPPAAPPADVAAWPAEVARLINEVRAAHGLPPFAYHPTLASAAQAHANDCSQRGWCSHNGSDGAYIKERLRRAGYEGAGWAECWAQSQSPQGAVDMWMDEVPPNDPHRRTLLSDWLTEIGLGVGDAGRGYYYFIADFGRP